MIKNDQQLRVTVREAEKFRDALAELDAAGEDTALADLERRAIRQQLDRLEQDVREYEALRSGGAGSVHAASLADLPHALVRARIAAGLTQKQLAERLGMKAQQVQRYEATEYAAASLKRLRTVADAVGCRVDWPAPSPNPRGGMRHRLLQAVPDDDFIRDRLMPSPDIWDGLEEKEASDRTVSAAVEVLDRVYGWTGEELALDHPLRVRAEAAHLARFRQSRGRNASKTAAYTVYARYLASVVAAATPQIQSRPLPDDPEEFAAVLRAARGELTLPNLLAFLWDQGVRVLPLRDSGAFQGAFWRFAGQNIIVLKQRTTSTSRWMHDCLHEVYHATQEPEQPERSVVENGEGEPAVDTEEEEDAEYFAGDVTLDCRADDLAEICVAVAGGSMQNLKRAVVQVAGAEGVDVGSLANYVAVRVQRQGGDWWGAATNLQPEGPDPWTVCRDWLVPRLTFDALDTVDAGLLRRALS